jgi:hypothetical protein
MGVGTVRQATVPDKDPVVMRLIRAEQSRRRFANEMTVRKYRQTFPDDYHRLIAAVAREAFDDVLPRFHTVHNQEVEPYLYELDGKDIIVGKPAHEFLKENARAVDLLALAGWVAFTEQFTSAPKLFEKIAGARAKRKQLASYRTFLGTTDGFVCFYCGVPVPQNAPVDHFIPWAFVLEDKIWNLVLACASCNTQKSNAVASKKCVEQLNERNEKLIAKSLGTLPPLVSSELAEWRVRSLRDHLILLAERCLLDGFPEWCR